MNTRTKFTNIKKETKKKVFERDNGCCILCGRRVTEEYANAHIVPRSKGGLGIEENIVTLCMGCHHSLDATTQRKILMPMVIGYIEKKYEGWNEADMVFRKEMIYE